MQVTETSAEGLKREFTITVPATEVEDQISRRLGEIAQSVRIPVIASGGAGGAQHFVEVFREGCADAALAASIFHFGLSSISELKKHLQVAGVPVRFPC